MSASSLCRPILRNALCALAAALSACATANAYTYASPTDWVTKSRDGALLPLASEAGAWSDPKTFDTKSGALAVQSKFVKWYGTTCVYEVRVTNPGTVEANEEMAIVKEDATQQYEHRFSVIHLAPGNAAVWDMEQRECALHFGDSTEMKSCAECRPVLGFRQ